jgi:predicted dehydrogenase
MRIGIAGLGFMGTTHLKALAAVTGAELAAVASSSESKLAGDLSAVAGNLGGPGQRFDFSRLKRYRTMEAMFADPGIEAVDLCLPTYLHADAAIAALRAGKHVLVEKPMALDGAACTRMIREAERGGRVLMTAQVLRFFPEYAALGELLASRRLGTVRSAVFRRRCAKPGWGAWLADASKSGGGVFDLLIHDIDMCLHLFGSPESVTATGYEHLALGIDVVHATLYYADGKNVNVSGGWHHAGGFPFSMEYTIVADGGTVEYNSAGRPATLYGEGEPLPLAAADGYAAEIAYFIECASAGKRPERCMPEESARAVELARLILEARKRNGEKIHASPQ